MQAFTRPAARAAVVLLLSSLTGCAAFPAGKLADSIDSPAIVGVAPRVALEFEATVIPEGLKPPQSLISQCQVALVQSGLMEIVGRDARPDLYLTSTIGLEAPTHLGGLLLSSFTLFLIPGKAASMHYSLDAQIISAETGESVEFERDETLNTWFGLVFLPMFVFNIPSVEAAKIENLLCRHLAVEIHRAHQSFQASGSPLP
jgi:hypothetical protein